MLQQILQDMYIDPDVLDGLNEDQKKTLFSKMRQEQVRRWQEREEKLEREGGDADSKRTKPKKANGKNVTWLLGRDGDVAVVVIGEVDELSSKFICSGLGQKKSPPSLQNNTQHQSILTNRKTTVEPNRTERANLSPATSGTQLNKAKCEEISTLHPLPVSVSEHSYPSAAEQPELKAASTTKETSTPQLSICSMLLMRASPVNVRAASATVAPGSVHDWPGVAGLKSTAATQPPSLSNTARTEPENTSITKAPQEDPLSHAALNDKDVGSSQVAPRSASEDATSSGNVTPPCAGRGRVAKLMKAFSVESSMGPGQTLTRGIKPPIPTKPSHLRLTTTPSAR